MNVARRGGSPVNRSERSIPTTRGGRTIYDVAKRAGVSISTVSLALNSPNRVSHDTLDRVFSAVQELGYLPKAEAALRARKATRRIGVVAPFTAYGSFEERLRGVMAAAGREGYEVVLYDHESAALRHHLVDSLPLSRKLDGLILMSIPISDRLAERLLQDGLATVLIEFARPEFSSIVIDDEEGGRLAADYLLGQGHRRIAFVGEVADAVKRDVEYVVTQKDARLQGFRSRLSRAKVGLPEEQILDVPNSSEGARLAALKFLVVPNPPTAVFAHSDVLAAGVLQAARELGMAVPNELAVVGFDDMEFAAYLGLTTVRQPLVDSGEIAIRLLNDQLAGKTSGVRQEIRLPLEIVPRQTA